MLSDLLQDVSLFRILHRIDRYFPSLTDRLGVAIGKAIFITPPAFVIRGDVPR